MDGKGVHASILPTCLKCSLSEPGAWTAAGLTLKLDVDGKLHIYQTGTTTNVVPPHNPLNVTGISVTGRDPSDIFIDNYSGSYNTLSINHATLKINQDNAIPAITAVTVDNGGVLDLDGKTDTIGSLLLHSGSVINGTLHAGSYTIESGTVTASISGTGDLLKTTSAQATVGIVNTANTTVSGGELIADSIFTGVLTVSPGATVTIAPIAGGPLGTFGIGNTLTSPIASSDMFYSTTDITPTEEAASNSDSTAISAGSEDVTAKPLAEVADLAVPTAAPIETVAAIPTVPIAAPIETPIATQITASSILAVALVSADSVSNAIVEATAMPVTDVARAPSSLLTGDFIPSRSIDVATKHEALQSPIYSQDRFHGVAEDYRNLVGKSPGREADK